MTTRLSAAPSAMPDEGPVRVLVVDDEQALRRLLVRILGEKGFQVVAVENGAEALAHASQREVDVALVDLQMPGMNGLELLSKLKALYPELSVILMTAFADVEVAVSAMKDGAFYFFNKPFVSNDAVVAIVAKAAEHHRLLERAQRMQAKLEAQERFGELVGTSPPMQGLYRMIAGVGPTTSTVLTLGESGTGKELVARAIHQTSQRAARPLVAVNCGAIPKELIEAELFGHVRGAFTGAHVARRGLFESADGGTVFLDEVGDLPLPAQVKLLRTLQNGEVRAVGSDETRIVDVRVIAATNVDLAEKIEAGTFRRDLFYRLNVIAITVPPLRDRGDDVLALASHFLQKLARRMGRPEKRLSSAARDALLACAWPGNVRELEHAIERAFVLGSGRVIDPTDLPSGQLSRVAARVVKRPRTERPPGTDRLSIPPPLLALPYATAKRRAMALFDEAYLDEQLRQSGGNRALAARRSGLDRANLRRVLRRSKRA